jgi:hypothetical protein
MKEASTRYLHWRGGVPAVAQIAARPRTHCGLQVTRVDDFDASRSRCAAAEVREGTAVMPEAAFWPDVTSHARHPCSDFVSAAYVRAI